MTSKDTLSSQDRAALRTFRKMFRCDTVRIVKPRRIMFLVIGWKRNTATSGAGTWIRNGWPVDFEYVETQIVAMGTTYAALLASAKAYKKLLASEKRRVARLPLPSTHQGRP